MSGLIKFDVVGTDNLEVFLDRLTFEMQIGLTSTMQVIAQDLYNVIVYDKLAGGVLNRVSGRLADSVKSEIVNGDNSVALTISADTPYAAIQEYGGTVHFGDEFPITARALLFEDGTFHSSSRAHSINIPARSYMQSTMDEMRGQIEDMLTQALTNNLQDF